MAGFLYDEFHPAQSPADRLQCGPGDKGTDDPHHHLLYMRDHGGADDPGIFQGRLLLF